MNTAPSGASCRTIATEYEVEERTKDVVLSTLSWEISIIIVHSQYVTLFNESRHWLHHLDVLDHALKVQASGLLLVVAILFHICVAYSTCYTIVVAWCRREMVTPTTWTVQI